MRSPVALASRTIDPMLACSVCEADLSFLRTADRPDYESPPSPVRLADLFCGGGGLTIGLAETARRLGRGTDVVLAVEQDDRVADIYGLNFPCANLVRADVADLFDGQLGARATPAERHLRAQLTPVDILVAGPPCQGHSDLNNRSRRRDPRNGLYLRAVRAAEILRPRFVLFENVPAIEHDASDVVDVATKALTVAGFVVASAVLDLVRFGVPQRRRRHILLATLGRLVEPSVVLDAASTCAQHPPRSVAWAIKDLLARSGSIPFDTPSVPTNENRERMQWLLKNDKFDLPNKLRPKCHHSDHSYISMYGRLSWDDPAQTITTGFGSMGQGRFVHPVRARTLTPHEAARLQTLPDFFKPGEASTRGVWARIIGNAVPPLLALHVVEPLLCALVSGEETAAFRSTHPRASAAPDRRRKGVPAASSEVIRVRMSKTKRRETAPEVALRTALHRLGFRYRVDLAVDGTRRRADIVFPTERLAIFVDGCFWHACPVHGTLPKRNHDWWAAKLAGNKDRDRSTDLRLRANGWEVLRFWEHDDPASSAALVKEALLTRRLTRPRRTGS